MKIKVPDADIEYYPGFIPAQLALDYYNQLKQNLSWREDNILMFGKLMPIPRLQAWYGDVGIDYTYSNLTLSTIIWTPLLAKLRNKVSEHCRCQFNAVLANQYRDQRDSVGWHSDDEPELGTNPVIASLSFGGERDFQLRHNQSKQKLNLSLTPGSLLVMKGTTQSFWQHCIPKRTRKMPPRINLTFRKILKKNVKLYF